ncbi:hypothetical protein ACQJBY_058839 [Aegilops geniculata]|uniref:Uncharacterized protein n=1 Tax=Triticum turgidum subsp. durum TaxID=4567 RepID=A0A9R0Y2F1_TRITD|nr:unnamed protein product [Triticum turgidum subsp. durum]
MESSQTENLTDTKQDDDARQSKQEDEEARIEEYKRLMDQKIALRRNNQNPERPGSHRFLPLMAIP